jgi:hypothetical protein
MEVFSSTGFLWHIFCSKGEVESEKGGLNEKDRYFDCHFTDVVLRSCLLCQWSGRETRQASHQEQHDSVA